MWRNSEISRHGAAGIFQGCDMIYDEEIITGESYEAKNTCGGEKKSAGIGTAGTGTPEGVTKKSGPAEGG